MRLFKRNSSKSGYSNISEPVSDLDPARISAIKARHSKRQIQKEIENIPRTNNDETFLTEAVTLETSPSTESNKSKHDAITSTDASPQSIRKKPLVDSPTMMRTGIGVQIPLHSANDQLMSSSDLKLESKTPETFFGGKNRKRVSNEETVSSSPAPTENPIVAVSIGGEIDECKQIRVSYDNHLNDDVDTQSQTSDLDKSFSPEIESVRSEITDPSYGETTRRKKQKSWKSFRKLRRYMHDSLGSKNNEQKDPVSFLDMIMDAICSYPANKR